MYKTQISCAIIILFLGLLYFTAKNSKQKSSKWFSALLVTSFFQLLFDIFSVYTVNHLTTVSPIVNRIIHCFYMGLMLIIFYIAYKYLETIIEEEIGKPIKQNNLSLPPLIIMLLGIIFLPLSYIETPDGNYSYGPAAFTTYFGVAIYAGFIVKLMIQHGKKLPPKKNKAILFALLSEIPIAIYQIIFPLALITSLGMVLLNLGIYLTTENPDALLAEQLKQEKKRADIANKAKTSFLANMSHEIRTPINAVLGINEMILRESQEKEIKEYAKDVEGAAKSLLSIINDILDITKIEAGKLTIISAEYDFSSMIRDVINMISFKAKVKELEFNIIIDETIPAKLIGDDIRLRQILVNILNNAVKYTPQGSITLEIQSLPTEEENMALLLFKVKDTGIGIKEEDLQKLCTPFERIEEKRNRNIEGTGLGMSITKQLLTLLHSQLNVSSVYGEGSEFSFQLHQEKADAASIGKLDTRMETYDNSYEYHPTYEAPSAKVLLIDDNEMNRKVFVNLLKATKIQIDQADSGKSCLEMVAQNAYDIIFLDHMMPELDGVETFRIMKQMTNYPCENTPVVILTANAIVGAREKYLEEGFHAFLSKPIDYKKLENLIKDMLDDSLICPVTATSTKTIEKEDQELPLIDGLDWKYANTHFPNQQMMLESLTFFTSTIEYEAQELENLFSNINASSGLDDYRTKVHSMKNSAATIGIIPLAGMAKVLEDSARNGEMDVITLLTPIFLKRWKGYKEHLASFSDAPDTESKQTASSCQEEIIDIMHKIKIAAENMDIDELDSLWECLAEYQFEEEQKELLESIHKAILNFDIDFLQNPSNLFTFGK